MLCVLVLYSYLALASKQVEKIGTFDSVARITLSLTHTCTNSTNANQFLAGIVHTAAGVTIGGLAGLLLFKAGKGNRAMSMATGLGVAIGSTYERAAAAKAE